jgi:hypothetical protein
VTARRVWAVTLAVFAIVGSAAAWTDAGWEPRDKRFHQRGVWSLALSRTFPELAVEFNGVDFGHSHLYETLILTNGQDVAAVEDRARRQTLAFIASRPELAPNEEAIAPTYMRLAWRAQNVFDEAHALHRATYDIYASGSVTDKDAAIRAALTYYQRSPYAVTAQRLDHARLDQFPYSQAFRRGFPLFNATIWAYHYLQGAAYEPLASGGDLAARRARLQPVLAAYRGYLERPPVEWTFMPLTGELSPEFARRHPGIANIFDNLHMLHDNISDILVSETLPTREAKRAEIYRLLDAYYLASADAANPMIAGTPATPHAH